MSSGESHTTLMLQTCDPHIYLPMLRRGRSLNEHYAAKWGLWYSSFVGMKRGFHPWHAAYNRVHLMKEQLDSGFRGWIFYLDADADVVDLDFDLPAYLRDHAQHAMIAGPGGGGGERWDVNTGILMMNLGHPTGRQLVELWYADVMSTPDAHLAAALNWDDLPCDQTRMHAILAARPDILADIFLMDRTLVTGWNAQFARQVLRVAADTFEDRMATMSADIATVLAQIENAPTAETAPPTALAAAPSSALTHELATYATVAMLYREILGRGADPDGLEHYAQKIQELGLTEGRSFIIADLVQSDEYRAKNVPAL